jgi:Type II secretory pathway, pseudopilin PulG
MPRAKRTERGLTLIEVTLAIVIGIVVVGGATLLYRQAAVSAGNVKAQNKTAALAVIVEEQFVKLNRYPTHDQLRKHWLKYREDALLSPWGGPIGSLGQGDAQGIVMSADPFTAPWEADRYYNPDYAGTIAYMVAANGTEGKDVTEYESGRTRTYRGYVIAIWNQDGHDPCFVAGPSFGGH